MLMLAFIRE